MPMILSREELRRELEKLRQILHQVVQSRHVMATDLGSMADELDEQLRKINISKVSGSTAAVVGGTLATVGFALSFFTFGASLGLTIAGGVLAGAGGLTVGGASIAELVLTRERMKDLSKVSKQYNQEKASLQKECFTIGNGLQNIGNVDKLFSFWVKFWAKLVFTSGTTLKNVGWDLIGKTILNVIRAGTYIDDFARVGAEAGTTAFRAIGSSAGRFFHVGGGVLGILMIPVDIYTLVDSSVALHKKKPHEVSQILRAMAADLLTQCPTDMEIDQMIDHTLRQIQ